MPRQGPRCSHRTPDYLPDRIGAGGGRRPPAGGTFGCRLNWVPRPFNHVLRGHPILIEKGMAQPIPRSGAQPCHRLVADRLRQLTDASLGRQIGPTTSVFSSFAT